MSLVGTSRHLAAPQRSAGIGGERTPKGSLQKTSIDDYWAGLRWRLPIKRQFALAQQCLAAFVLNDPRAALRGGRSMEDEDAQGYDAGNHGGSDDRCRCGGRRRKPPRDEQRA